MHAWEQIQQTLDYLEDHLDEKISIDNLAKTASLSPFYYQRLFSRLVGKPVAEYLKLRRMAKATEALLQKDRRILDIALELGFTSHEHFTRTFKDTFGMTPDEYRCHPVTLNRMTKPQLLLHYALVDEGAPLVTDGIVLEINRRSLEKPVTFIGLNQKTPVSFIGGLGTESGIDPLAKLWQDFHIQKEALLKIPGKTEEIGITHPSSDPGYFNYFAGTFCSPGTSADGCVTMELPAGNYIVCSFEAENFEALVMDALYKAEQYIFNIWLPHHNLLTEPFCAERYASHSPETTSMEVWLKQIG